MNNRDTFYQAGYTKKPEQKISHIIDNSVWFKTEEQLMRNSTCLVTSESKIIFQKYKI